MVASPEDELDELLKSTPRAIVGAGRQEMTQLFYFQPVAVIPLYAAAKSGDEKMRRLLWMLFANPDTSTRYVQVGQRLRGWLFRHGTACPIELGPKLQLRS
jgi:hypothetical protein